MEGPGTARTVCGPDYHCLKDLMFQYRRQAAELNVMADRYAGEADTEARELGPNSESAKKSREMARKFSLQAREADRLAHDYAQELPHNVY
jgi:hypothetical protein